jgi:hypothetical protein
LSSAFLPHYPEQMSEALSQGWWMLVSVGGEDGPCDLMLAPASWMESAGHLRTATAASLWGSWSPKKAVFRWDCHLWSVAGNIQAWLIPVPYSVTTHILTHGWHILHCYSKGVRNKFQDMQQWSGKYLDFWEKQLHCLWKPL